MADNTASIDALAATLLPVGGRGFRLQVKALEEAEEQVKAERQLRKSRKSRKGGTKGAGEDSEGPDLPGKGKKRKRKGKGDSGEPRKRKKGEPLYEYTGLSSESKRKGKTVTKHHLPPQLSGEEWERCGAEELVKLRAFAEARVFEMELFNYLYQHGSVLLPKEDLHENMGITMVRCTKKEQAAAAMTTMTSYQLDYDKQKTDDERRQRKVTPIQAMVKRLMTSRNTEFAQWVGTQAQLDDELAPLIHFYIPPTSLMSTKTGRWLHMSNEKKFLKDLAAEIVDKMKLLGRKEQGTGLRYVATTGGEPKATLLDAAEYTVTPDLTPTEAAARKKKRAALLWYLVMMEPAPTAEGKRGTAIPTMYRMVTIFHRFNNLNKEDESDTDANGDGDGDDGTVPVPEKTMTEVNRETRAAVQTATRRELAGGSAASDSADPVPVAAPLTTKRTEAEVYEFVSKLLQPTKTNPVDRVTEILESLAARGYDLDRAKEYPFDECDVKVAEFLLRDYPAKYVCSKGSGDKEKVE